MRVNYVHTARTIRQIFRWPHSLVSTMKYKNSGFGSLPLLGGSGVAYHCRFFSDINERAEGIEKDVENEDMGEIDEFSHLFGTSGVNEKSPIALPIGAHSVLILQPKVVWGPHKPCNTNAQLMLEESAALIRTLPGWRVNACQLVNVKFDVDHSQVFGSGNLDKLTARISADSSTTAVFVNVDVLSPVQQSELYKIWKKPVFDRYQIVLSIFKTFARSKLAKLHVAAAEMPYIAARLRELTIGAVPDTFHALENLGGYGFKLLEERANMFKRRESALKKALGKVRKSRLESHEQMRKHYPVVAVIGYTNSGKTSLVNCLTKSLRQKENENLEPKDRLFATLDCTMYLGELPTSCIKTYFGDTVGFVADIPATLVACFEATLDSIRFASLIVHVIDVSHPDSQLQQDTVYTTLRKLNLPKELTDNILKVRNKIDKVTKIDIEPESEKCFSISCLTGEGISRLQNQIDRMVRITDKFVTVCLRVPNGGEELRYLQENTSISKYDELDDGNYLLVTCTMHDHKLKSIFRLYGNLLHRKPAVQS